MNITAGTPNYALFFVSITKYNAFQGQNRHFSQ